MCSIPVYLKLNLLVTQLCPILCDPMEFARQENTGVGSHTLLHRIFPTQGSNSFLLHSKQILYLYFT